MRDAGLFEQQQANGVLLYRNEVRTENAPRSNSDSLATEATNTELAFSIVGEK